MKAFTIICSNEISLQWRSLYMAWKEIVGKSGSREWVNWDRHRGCTSQVTGIENRVTNTKLFIKENHSLKTFHRLFETKSTFEHVSRCAFEELCFPLILRGIVNDVQLGQRGWIVFAPLIASDRDSVSCFNLLFQRLCFLCMNSWW